MRNGGIGGRTRLRRVQSCYAVSGTELYLVGFLKSARLLCYSVQAHLSEYRYKSRYTSFRVEYGRNASATARASCSFG